MYGSCRSNVTCSQLGGGGGCDDAPDLLNSVLSEITTLLDYYKNA